ncbi:MAG: helix-turn-helix transcriptional regulator, partial [Ruminiclostridium sp.]|nr:helix-turn-helix transcriptional regulator [Ruminiclostridium sp.]
MVKITLSTKLGELRMTQAELSRKTGIRPSTISEWYNGFAERI